MNLVLVLTAARITFNDLPVAGEKSELIPDVHRGLKWSQIYYAHELYMKKKHSKSGYVTLFTPGNSSQIAYFSEKASITVEGSK